MVDIIEKVNIKNRVFTSHAKVIQANVTYHKYVSVWKEIKKAIDDKFKFSKYNKDYTMIRFGSDDILPLHEIFWIESVIIVIRSVLSKDGVYYPQIFLDDLLYKV